MASIYKGFSTVGRERKFRLTDFELIKQDIINHFYIRKGEKLMRPNFGTIIWNVINEPLTEDLRSVIVADIKNVGSYDPRVSMDNVIVTEYSQGIQVELELRYLTTNQTNVMRLQFDNQTSTITAI